MPSKSNYSLVPDVLFRMLGDEGVLVNLRTEQMTVLNRTAAQFWKLLQEGWDVTRIEEEMLKEYKVDQNRLRSEWRDLLQRLEAEGMLDGRN